MDAIDLLETPWKRGVSRLQVAPKGQDYIDITECVEEFDVARYMKRAGMWSAELSFWYESPNLNTTKQLFVLEGEMVVEFRYKYYPAGKDVPYCMGEMLLPRIPIGDIFVRGVHLEFRLSGNPVLKSCK